MHWVYHDEMQYVAGSVHVNFSHLYQRLCGEGIQPWPWNLEIESIKHSYGIRFVVAKKFVEMNGKSSSKY